MSDTPQPWGWAFRHLDDADYADRWCVTRSVEEVEKAAASGQYEITTLYDAPPDAPAVAPVKESVTTATGRTLREDAAMQLTARVMGEKVSGKAFSQWLAQAKIEDITDLCVEAADALSKSLKEKQ